MVLGLILTITIGRFFFSLAHDHHRHAWGFAILGGGVFFGAQLILGVILALILTFTGNLDVLTKTSTSLMINFGGLAVSGIICWILYAMLKKSWTKNPRNQKENSDLIDQ